MLARADFNPQDFEDLIQQKGYRIWWEPVIICPCIDPATTRAVEGCPQCDGRGRYYHAALAKEIKGLITHQTTQMQVDAQAGRLQPGQGYLTVSASNKITQFDRITNLNSLGIYHETVVYQGANEVHHLRYVPSAAIELACYQPTRTSNIVLLTQGVDYTVNTDMNSPDGGKIDFISDKKPVVGSGVSFRYVHHPVWLVTGIPNYIRDTFVQMGNPVDTNTPMPIRVEIQLEIFGKARG